MNPGMFINPGIIALRIHVFVDYHGQTLFGLVEPADDPEHLIHDRFNLLAVMMDQMTAVLSDNNLLFLSAKILTLYKTTGCEKFVPDDKICAMVDRLKNR